MLREALGDLPVTEKRMFGGTCMMLNGHMLCGTIKCGALFRVGKTGHQEALTLPGLRPMNFTGKPMAGFVECDAEVLAEDETRNKLMALALAFNKTPTPK